MGFCRRCGDIVTSLRCDKCGGFSVAPAISWNQIASKDDQQDKWSKTYVSRDRSASPVRPRSGDPPEGTFPSPIKAASSPMKRFPRPTSAQLTGHTPIDTRVSDHIASTASQASHPASPARPTATGPKPEAGILPSITPNDTTLSKVYGSVLQSKEMLTTYCCATCSTPFLPDATIYPDPSIPVPDEPRFLCRQCFVISGGSKGLCPSCSKPVTILKSEGGFVYAADKYWHKRCFNCEGCSKNMGHSPMVDLLGRPSCTDCFETCLSREPRTPKKWDNKLDPYGERRNPGGYELAAASSTKFREPRSSPAIEELEQRLGIAKSREGSPAIEELGQRLSTIGKDYQKRYSSPSSSPAPDRSLSRSTRSNGSPSPTRRWERFKSPDLNEQLDTESPSVFGSPRRVPSSASPTAEAIEGMKRRFLKSLNTSPVSSTVTLLESPTPTTRPLRTSQSSACLRTDSGSRIPVPISRTEPWSLCSSTPDLMSDFSDSLTQSSFSDVDSPPSITESLFSQQARYNRTDLLSDPNDTIIEETKSQLNTPNQTPQSTIKVRADTLGTPTKCPPSAKLVSSTSIEVTVTATCTKCRKALFSLGQAGKFVTIPGDKAEDSPQTYHRDCFRCSLCSGIFKESDNGQAIFVRSSTGPAHIECAPLETMVIRKSPSANSLRFTHEKASLRSGYGPEKNTSPSPHRINTINSSSRFERPISTAPPTTTSFPRFGSRSTCPGCHKSVSPMERGVVPGPQGSRWHAPCLVCGGKQPSLKSKSWIPGKDEEKKQPGCGKKLDSAAKTDADGRIWCRECLLILGIGGSPQASPTRTPLMPFHTNKIAPQLTGTTTIARQFTGLGTDGSLLRQLTGGSTSPTRSLSPTKQLGSFGGLRPRPKSVIGTRSSKSVDEGRGMFLVRQLTGTSSSSHWEES